MPKLRAIITALEVITSFLVVLSVLIAAYSYFRRKNQK